MGTKKQNEAAQAEAEAIAPDREEEQNSAIQALQTAVTELQSKVEAAASGDSKVTNAVATSLTSLWETVQSKLYLDSTRIEGLSRELAYAQKGTPLPLTEEMIAALKAPLPPEAVTSHPTKDFLSSIKTIYTIERLNEVFGVAGWDYTSELIEAGEDRWITNDRGEKKIAGMIVVKVTLTVPKYGIRKEAFGGNNNDDRGDAYKGAVTDAISKIGGMLYIGMDVYKGFGPSKSNGNRRTPQRSQAPATAAAGTSQTSEPVPPCVDCKNEIKTVEVGGDPYSPAQLVANSRKAWRSKPEDKNSPHDGPALCGDCQAKRRRAEREAKKQTAPPPPSSDVASNGAAAPIR